MSSRFVATGMLKRIADRNEMGRLIAESGAISMPMGQDFSLMSALGGKRTLGYCLNAFDKEV